MQIYYQPHRGRKKEAAFVQALIQLWDITEVIPHNFPVPMLSSEISITNILIQLEQNLPKGKKWPLLVEHLKELPSQIKLFKSISEISCDVVLVKNGKPYFIEYHEKQHRILSIDKPKNVYSLEGKSLIVPRYVQRFLRDVWRIQNLHPFTLIWDHKFQTDGLNEFQCAEDEPYEFGDNIMLLFKRT
jgi:hypothetical protein